MYLNNGVAKYKKYTIQKKMKTLNIKNTQFRKNENAKYQKHTSQKKMKTKEKNYYIITKLKSLF